LRYIPIKNDEEREKSKSIRNLSWSKLNDKKLTQKKINSLRKIITESIFFDDDYKRRLLKKLEKFQSALHSSDSVFDRLTHFFDVL